MEKRHKTKTSPAQQDSRNSILGVGVLGILRSLGILGEQPITKATPAQRDSRIYKLRASPYRPYSPYRPLAFKTTSAQPDSGNSKLAIRPLCPYCPFCPLVLKTAPAQRDSGISKLDFSLKLRVGCYDNHDIVVL